MDFTTVLNALMKWYNPFPGDVIAEAYPETNQYAVHWRSAAPIDECGNLLGASYHVTITGNCCQGAPEYTLQILRLNRGYKDHILTVNTGLQVSAVSEPDYCIEGQALRHRHLLLNEWSGGPLNYTPNFVIFLDSLIRYFNLSQWSIEDDFNGVDIGQYLTLMRNLDTLCRDDDDEETDPPWPPPLPPIPWPRIPRIPRGKRKRPVDEPEATEIEIPPGTEDDTTDKGELCIPAPYYITTYDVGSSPPDCNTVTGKRIFCWSGIPYFRLDDLWYGAHSWRSQCAGQQYMVAQHTEFTVDCETGGLVAKNAYITYGQVADLDYGFPEPNQPNTTYFHCFAEKVCTKWAVTIRLETKKYLGLTLISVMIRERTFMVQSNTKPVLRVDEDGLPWLDNEGGETIGPLGYSASTWVLYNACVCEIRCIGE